MSLKTTIAGKEIESCIFNASGCWCTTSDELNELVNSNAGAVVSKSGTVLVRKGNPEPRLDVTDPYGSINSMGVPNLGYQFYTDFGNEVDGKTFIQSLIPFSEDDLQKMLSDINENTSTKRHIEVNLSCPNIIHKSIVGLDFDLFEKYVKIMQDLDLPNLILGIKLPPYYQISEWDKVSEIILKYPVIKFITCINSVVNGLSIDVNSQETLIHPKNGLGGVGGSYCKPTALANVNQFYRRLGDRVDIIGCGGVENGDDVVRHILAGATAVEVGTQLMKSGPTIFETLNKQTMNYMEKYGYKQINDFKGALKVKATKL